MVSSYAAVLQPLLAHHGGLASEHQAAAFVAHLQQGFNTPLARCLACTILQLTPAATCGALLDAGLLPVLASWLGAAVQLQHDHAALLLQQLLPVLQRLPVDKDAVKACGAGRWLQALAKPHQPPTLQAAAQAVKAAWLESVKRCAAVLLDRVHCTTFEGNTQRRVAVCLQPWAGPSLQCPRGDHRQEG